MFKFDIAISYAGEEEGIAEDLHRILRENDIEVFFAKPCKVYLFGKRLTPEIKNAFGPYTKFVVPIISKHYIEKYWPKLEFRIAKEEEKHRRFEFILPILLDDIQLEDLETDLVYINLRKEGIFSSADTIIKKLREHYPMEEISVPKVWVATFGVVIENLLEKNEFPSSAPRDYVHLCDWLEKDLVKRILESPIQNFELPEASHRDGETLSIRIAFEWDPEKYTLDFGDIGWWEVLEIAEFEEIYSDQSGEDFLNL